MKIEPFNISELIQNPAGKGSTAFASRELIRTKVRENFYKIKDKIKMEVFKYKNTYLFKFKIPSESVDDFYYDAVLLLYPENGDIQNERTIRNYKIDMFSNMPSFVFTYLNTIYENDMIIDFMRSKLPKSAMKQEAELRNPTGSFGFEKSIYYSALYIYDNHDNLNKEYLDRISEKFDKGKFMKDIMDYDSIEKLYRMKKMEIREVKKKERDREKKRGLQLAVQDPKERRSKNGIKSINKNEKVKSSKEVKKVGDVKRSSTIKPKKKR